MAVGTTMSAVVDSLAILYFGEWLDVISTGRSL